MQLKRYMGAVWLCLAMGCGDDDPANKGSESGLSPELSLSHLSESERDTFCRWLVELQGGEGSEVTCGDNAYTLSLESCLSSASAKMPVSVADAEACALDMVEQGSLCAVTESAACERVREYLASLPPANSSCKGDSDGGKNPSNPGHSTCESPVWGW